MAKDILFMLDPWLDEDGSGPYYCPDCGVVEGFLFYSPGIRTELEIIPVEFPRPRAQIVALLGLENQSSPVLVLDDAAPVPEGARQSLTTGTWFIDDAQLICTYLAERYNGIMPHS